MRAYEGTRGVLLVEDPQDLAAVLAAQARPGEVPRNKEEPRGAPRSREEPRSSRRCCLIATLAWRRWRLIATLA